MKYEIIVNNYNSAIVLRTIGKTKLIVEERLDKNHTRLVFQNLYRSELTTLEKING